MLGVDVKEIIREPEQEDRQAAQSKRKKGHCFAINAELQRGQLPSRHQGNEKLLGIQDSSVSKRHALIYLDSGKLLLKDLGSSNGTLLNNRPLPNWRPREGSDPVEIKGDCAIRLGSTEMELRVEAPPMYDDLAKMVKELRLEQELGSRHPEKDVQRLANSFRIILDINNNLCNTRTKVKDLRSRFEGLMMYLKEEELVKEVDELQRRFAAELFEEESLRDEHVRELKAFCTRFTEMWGAKFMA